MGFFEGTENEVNVVLTDKGKEDTIREGILKQLIYFSLYDDEVIYWLDVEPEKLVDVTGIHTSSTAINNYFTNKINV